MIKGEDYREEAGLDDIDAALALNPEIPGGRMSEAVLLYELKRYEAAIKSFDAVIATDSTELKAAHYYRGDSYYELGNKEKACADWDISAKLGDKDAHLHQEELLRDRRGEDPQEAGPEAAPERHPLLICIRTVQPVTGAAASAG